MLRRRCGNCSKWAGREDLHCPSCGARFESYGPTNIDSLLVPVGFLCVFIIYVVGFYVIPVGIVVVEEGWFRGDERKLGSIAAALVVLLAIGGASLLLWLWQRKRRSRPGRLTGDTEHHLAGDENR